MERELDWTLLPDELLVLVLQKLHFLADNVHFGAVCKSWNNVARKERYQRLPLLLVPGKEGSEQKRGLYNVVDNTYSECQVSVGYDWRCCGSCLGCLFFASKTNFIISKPFTSNAVIKLPPVIFGVPVEREDLYKRFVDKVVISCDPYICPNDYEIVVICELTKLAIFRAGDDDWTVLEDNLWLATYQDVIYYKGAFYAIDMWMGIGKIEVDQDTRSYKIELFVPEFVERFDASAEDRFGMLRVCYLIESSKGELLCALKILRDEDDGNILQVDTSCFKVFKLVATPGNRYLEWKDIETLDGDALFLGANHSLAINMTNKFQFQPNCIYYTYDLRTYTGEEFNPFGPRDVGIFDLETKSFHPSFNFDFSPMPPALWIIPSLEETLDI